MVRIVSVNKVIICYIIISVYRLTVERLTYLYSLPLTTADV